jgi:phosphate transport system protein
MQREIENLKKKILTLSAIVEESVQEAVESICEKDARLAQQVIDRDARIDQMEVEVEEDCLKVLALYQPVAIDLRFVVALLKINTDLERMGDLAVNIAERAAFLASEDLGEIPNDLGEMFVAAQTMLHRSLDAFVSLDAELARQVWSSDDEVDAINRRMFVTIQSAIREAPEKVEGLIHLLSVSRHLERIADYATNIAEEVIYMIDGEIVRHRVENYVAHVRKEDGKH